MRSLLKFCIFSSALPVLLANLGLDHKTLTSGRVFTIATFNRRISSTIFLELLVVASFVPICKIKNSGCFLMINWISWLISLILAPEKWKTLTVPLIIKVCVYAVQNRVPNYSSNSSWSVIIASFTKTGFMFINIVRFGIMAWFLKTMTVFNCYKHKVIRHVHYVFSTTFDRNEERGKYWPYCTR